MSASFAFTDPSSCRAVLEERLAEPAPGRIQLVAGPRQVGKTTILLELADRLGAMGLYAPLDAPEAALAGYWDRLWEQGAATASREGKAVLLLDEVQHLGDWAGQLKVQWDRIRRTDVPVHVVATGSSALRLGRGSKETLAGRFERLVLGHWSARAIATTFGLSEEDAAMHLVRFGSYPGSVPFVDDKRRWSAYVRDAIIEPAIGRDIMALTQVRKPALLRQVFAAAVASPTRIVSLQKLQGQLQDRGALETLAHYLSVLEDAYLVASLQKYSSRPLRRRSSPPKLVVLNNALLSAVQGWGVVDAALDPERFGAFVENACLAFAWNSGQEVSYWREEPHEVDVVTEGDWGKWAIEVKTRPFRASDLGGLLRFVDRFRSFRPLVITGDEGAEVAARTGLTTRTWTEFLVSGPE